MCNASYWFESHCPFDLKLNVMGFPTIKDLVKDNNKARFSFLLMNDLLVYEVSWSGRVFEFSIPTSDLGDATLPAEEKAITLMRYIRKTMDKGQLIELAAPISNPDLNDLEVVTFSHYRNRVVYYIHTVDGKNYSFPVRFEDNEFDKLYSRVSVKSMEVLINKAKEANEYHPC